MAKITDIEIRNWIKKGERFEGRSVGGGLYLRFRQSESMPTWGFRYRFEGKARVMSLGSYRDLSLANAREEAKKLSARVALGYDVAGEKQQRKGEAIARIEAEKNAYTVAQLADEYFERMIAGRWKHPNIVRSRIEKDIKPAIGSLKVEDVKPKHIDNVLKAVMKRGAPSMANDNLRWLKRMFNYAIKRHIIEYNPAAAFDPSVPSGKVVIADTAHLELLIVDDFTVEVGYVNDDFTKNIATILGEIRVIPTFRSTGCVRVITPKAA
jgi:hypothetical protein